MSRTWPQFLARPQSQIGYLALMRHRMYVSHGSLMSDMSHDSRTHKCHKVTCAIVDGYCLRSTLCNTLQHTATHCNTLQHTATHCNTSSTDTVCEKPNCSRALVHSFTRFDVLLHRDAAIPFWLWGIYVYIYVYMYMCVYMDSWMYIYVCVYVRVYICMYIYMCAFWCSIVMPQSVLIHRYTTSFISGYVCIYMYISTHIHMYICIHLYVPETIPQYRHDSRVHYFFSISSKYIHMYIHTHTYVHTKYIHMYISPSNDATILSWFKVTLLLFKHVYTCIYTHTKIHIHTYVHTYIYIAQVMPQYRHASRVYYFFSISSIYM